MNEPDEWELRYYQTPGQRVPFREFRIDLGPGYRGYFYRSGQAVMLLLCGGDKSTQGRDISRANEYRRDHEKRTRTGVDSG